jgi:hypothetical protein
MSPRPGGLNLKPEPTRGACVVFPPYPPMRTMRTHRGGFVGYAYASPINAHDAHEGTP